MKLLTYVFKHYITSPQNEYDNIHYNNIITHDSENWYWNSRTTKLSKYKAT